MMMTFPLLTCCEMLSIDPKTLRNWLRQAQIPLHLHPTDGRMKCLTMEQVEHLAALHGRALQPPQTPVPALAEPMSRQGTEPPARWEGEGGGLQTPSESCLLPEETAWLNQLAHLEAQVALLQEQLAGLRSLLRPLPPGAPAKPTVRHRDEQAGRKGMGVEETHGTDRKTTWQAHPAEQRRRPVLPLIEYGAKARYVVICPQEGELPIVPDSAEWFAWLASLTSFRFVGQLGRFSACRTDRHGPTRCWKAYREIHQRMHTHYLGGTERLSIATLEQMAARLQAEATAG